MTKTETIEAIHQAIAKGEADVVVATRQFSNHRLQVGEILVGSLIARPTIHGGGLHVTALGTDLGIAKNIVKAAALAWATGGDDDHTFSTFAAQGSTIGWDLEINHSFTRCEITLTQTIGRETIELASTTDPAEFVQIATTFATLANSI